MAVDTSVVQFEPPIASFGTPQVTAGGTDTVTIEVDNLAGDPLTGLTNLNFTLCLSGGTSTGTFSDVTETSTPGTYTANFTGVLGGSASTLDLTLNGDQFTTQATIQVQAGSVNGETSTFIILDPTVNTGADDAAIIAVRGSSGNPITGLTSSDFTFSLLGGTSTGSFGPVSETSTPGTYTANFTGAFPGNVTTVELEISGVRLAAKPTLTVEQELVDPGQTTASFANAIVTAGETDNLTMVVKDAAGGAITGLAFNDFQIGLSSGGSSGGTFSDFTETSTPGTYTVVFTAIKSGTTSSHNITINDVQITTEPTIKVNPGSADPQNCTFVLESPIDLVGSGDPVTLVLKDSEGNAISGLGFLDFSF